MYSQVISLGLLKPIVQIVTLRGPEKNTHYWCFSIIPQVTLFSLTVWRAIVKYSADPPFQVSCNSIITHLSDDTCGSYRVVAIQLMNSWIHTTSPSANTIWCAIKRAECDHTQGLIESFAGSMTCKPFSWWQVAEISSTPSPLMTCWPQDMSGC